MSISASIGKSLDQIFRSSPALATFTKAKASGEDLRRYIGERAHSQHEILFYRDKWWNKVNGGKLYVELFCLVSSVQLALSGMSQSLIAPDYNVPFHHFQYVSSEPQAKRMWELQSTDDIKNFESEINAWLHSVALPWLAQFDSNEGVIHFMKDKGHFHNLAIYLASLGDMTGARNSMSNWLIKCPRQIDNGLAKLVSVGLLSTNDQTFLSRASIQEQETYKQQLLEWMTMFNLQFDTDASRRST